MYLKENERERENKRRGGLGQADSVLNREPDVGLHPGTPGSPPEPKADI